mmetsp:Transcript_134444/g.287631  ORF Transcript_134444/g.287631 Transcript_134444/m.287631 type:complete len:246 (-) Transcript_134444:156-893(-)
MPRIASKYAPVLSNISLSADASSCFFSVTKMAAFLSSKLMSMNCSATTSSSGIRPTLVCGVLPVRSSDTSSICFLSFLSPFLPMAAPTAVMPSSKPSVNPYSAVRSFTRLSTTGATAFIKAPSSFLSSAFSLASWSAAFASSVVSTAKRYFIYFRAVFIVICLGSLGRLGFPDIAASNPPAIPALFMTAFMTFICVSGRMLPIPPAPAPIRCIARSRSCGAIPSIFFIISCICGEGRIGSSQATC